MESYLAVLTALAVVAVERGGQLRVCRDQAATVALTGHVDDVV